MAEVTAGFDLIGLPVSCATSRLESAGTPYLIRTTARPQRPAGATLAPGPSVQPREQRVVGCRPGADGLLLIVAEPAASAIRP